MRTYKNSSSGFGGSSNSSNVWSPVSVPDYNEDVTYDPNGNILKYRRFGASTTTALNNAKIMDSLNYKYLPNTNKLSWIKDSVPSFTVDIGTQRDSNYRYDAIGNLIKDSTGGIDSISWNVYGKIQKINKHNGTVINYYYDAAGNRIGKVITGGSSGNGETWYVHDASGNVMETYSVNDNTINSGALSLTEQDMYGSSRVGLNKPNINLITWTLPTKIAMNSLGSVGYNSSFIRGNKFFELSNHLGNVLVTVSDKKLGVDASGNNDGIIDYYNADIVSANDYYPFGMQMPGRDTVFKAGYRYGFNGKEMDNQPYGQGNEYDYGFRIYNPRIGRFLSVDELSQDYPELTPYQFASDNSIFGIDRDGREIVPNDWLFNIWLRWKFGDPSGTKSIVSGIEDKNAIETGQADYHNENVPTAVQQKLDDINDKNADIKIVKGVSKLTTKSISTSFNVTSSIIPGEEGVSEMGKGFSAVIRNSPKAEEIAVKTAEEIIATTSKGKLPRAVTVVVDTRTGEVYNGISGGLKDLTVDQLNPKLQKLLPKESLEKWDVTNCSECDAVNKALNNGANVSDLEMHTVKIDAKTGKIENFERCNNCKITTKDIKTTSDPKKKR